MKNLSITLVLFSLIFSGGLVAKNSCEYQVTKVKPAWTAYKFTEKAPVSGSFTKFIVSTSKKAKDLPSSIQSLSIKIDGASIESGNAGRNATVAAQFFAKFSPANQITATAVSVKGDDQKGKVTILIEMNAKKKEIIFDYKVDGKGNLSAEAAIDIMDFALKGPFDSIHKACKGLHTGKDGISKTWAEVLLKVSASLVKTCK